MLRGYNVGPIVAADKDDEGGAVVGMAVDQRCPGQNGGRRDERRFNEDVDVPLGDFLLTMMTSSMMIGRLNLRHQNNEHQERATMDIPCMIAMASATPSEIALVKLYQRVK